MQPNQSRDLLGPEDQIEEILLAQNIPKHHPDQ
jgi:hypothetical protein